MNKNRVFVFAVTVILILSKLVQTIKIGAPNGGDVSFSNEVIVDGIPVGDSVSSLLSELINLKSQAGQMNDTINSLQTQIEAAGGGGKFLDAFNHFGGVNQALPATVMDYLIPAGGNIIAYISITVSSNGICNYGFSSTLYFDGVSVGSGQTSGKWFDIAGGTRITVQVYGSGGYAYAPCVYNTGSGQIVGFS